MWHLINVKIKKKSHPKLEEKSTKRQLKITQMIAVSDKDLK